MATPDVKVPPDWLREPHFATRSELLDARKHDRKQLALDLTHDSRCFDKKFARSETIFRDSFRKSGAFDRAEQPALDPHQFHPRATCSGLLTRTAVLEKRCEDRNVANLKFEPQEIERFKDIPNADQLTNWWKLRDGYVEDPSSFCGNSLRLEMAKHGFALGPMDPAKVRCPASVDERRSLKEKKAMLADKVSKIAHSIPADYLTADRAETATLAHAPDLYAQERRFSDGGSGNGGGAICRSGSLPPAFPLVSPIKVPSTKPRRRPKSVAIENLFLESTNQRVLLDQLKTCQPLGLTSSSDHGRIGFGGGARPRMLAASSLSLLDPQSESNNMNPSGGKDCQDSVRCGGFS